MKKDGKRNDIMLKEKGIEGSQRQRKDVVTWFTANSKTGLKLNGYNPFIGPISVN